NGTSVFENGSLITVLNAGEFYESLITASKHFTSDKPVMVAQFSTGQYFDNVKSDPFMMTILSPKQFLSEYLFSVPETSVTYYSRPSYILVEEFFSSYINVVIRAGSESSLLLDGVPVSATFTPIASSGYMGASIPVTNEVHSVSADTTFGLYVYGFRDSESFGYPGGLSFKPQNSPPVADAGVDQTLECEAASSATATLNGSGSSDPDGDALTYSWSGPFGALSGVSQSVSMPFGPSTVNLTVDDGSGVLSSDSVVITVEDTTAPVLNAGPDVTIQAVDSSGAGYDVYSQVIYNDSCCAMPLSVDSNGTFPVGTTSVLFSGADCSGNISTDTMTVTVTALPPQPPPVPTGNCDDDDDSDHDEKCDDDDHDEKCDDDDDD
ncbi:MAG: hypothetical protein GY771_06720, partial [bacterium]|nr:hypothetical protein [bacterium]